MNIKYTVDGLPIVSRETIDVFQRDMLRRCTEGNDSEFSLEIVKRIVKENPYLANAAEEFYGQTNQRDGKPLEPSEDYYFGIGVTYELLRKQAESNNLERKE
ncbi:MAG: hypothetical protein Q7S74_05190 [Nanoarchaeota archaeon]|nr:hypothetical protein [Nanoarchaeota archaeon]